MGVITLPVQCSGLQISLSANQTSQSIEVPFLTLPTWLHCPCDSHFHTVSTFTLLLVLMIHTTTSLSARNTDFCISS